MSILQNINSRRQELKALSNYSHGTITTCGLSLKILIVCVTFQVSVTMRCCRHRPVFGGATFSRHFHIQACSSTRRFELRGVQHVQCL